MAEYFAGGHLRNANGEWRDDNGDAIEISRVRHGQWIEYTKVIIPEPYNKWEQAWKCSECGFDDGFVAYNYCPNCGAKMDGGDGNSTICSKTI